MEKKYYKYKICQKMIIDIEKHIDSLYIAKDNYDCSYIFDLIHNKIVEIDSLMSKLSYMEDIDNGEELPVSKGLSDFYLNLKRAVNDSKNKILNIEF